MFSTGISTDTRLYFSSATAVIAVPTAVKVYSWMISSINVSNRRNAVIRNAFLVCFTAGGFTGLILSNSSVDMCYHDTYYVVAHFHYVLSIGAFFASILVIRMLLASATTSQIAYSYGRINDLAVTLGVNTLFLLLHEVGRDGHPRRIPVSTEMSVLTGSVCNVGILTVLLAVGLSNAYSSSTSAYCCSVISRHSRKSPVFT
jgi:heme/copper-type cytochrome/quinol oxidase subunit 1